MRNYAGTCKGICCCNLVHNFDIVFAITKFSFCGVLFTRILAWNRGFSKGQFLESIVPLLVIIHLLYS